MMRIRKSAQEGFAIFIVLIIMLVIAFMVIMSVQSVNNESRVSTNDADHNFALSLADVALRAGEGRISNLTKQSLFSYECLNGLCLPAGHALDKTTALVGIEYPSGVTKKEDVCSFEPSGAGRSPSGCYIPAWERSFTPPGATSSLPVNVLDDTTGQRCVQVNTGVSDLPRSPCYIVEYLGVSEGDDAAHFRLTARAYGKNPNTTVTVQSYFVAVGLK